MPLGDKMHFIHSSSVFDDGDGDVSLLRIIIPPCSDLLFSTLLLSVTYIPWLEKKNCDVLCTC